MWQPQTSLTFVITPPNCTYGCRPLVRKPEEGCALTPGSWGPVGGRRLWGVEWAWALLPRVPFRSRAAPPAACLPGACALRLQLYLLAEVPAGRPRCFQGGGRPSEPNCILGVTPPWRFAYFPPGTAFLEHSPEDVTGPSLSLNLDWCWHPVSGGPWGTGSVTVWQRSEHRFGSLIS